MTDYYISDSIADPAYVKQISPYAYTTLFSQRKIYATQAAADADCLTLENSTGNTGRFGVHSHAH